jgi:MFS family permease
VSIAGTSLAMAGLGAGLAWGRTIAWLFCARIFSGIATANLGTASAYIADITKPEERAKGMGLIGMAFGLGFVLGPGVGGWLAKFPVSGHHGPLPCFVAAGLSAVNFVWAASGLVESLPPEHREAKRAAPTRSLTPLNLEAMRQAFSRPGVAIAVAVNFLIVVSFTNLDQTFTFFCGDRLHIDEAGTGFVLAAIGIVAAGVQGGLVRALAKKYDEAWLIRVGAAIQVAAFAGLVGAGTLGAITGELGRGRALLYLSGGVLAVGNGLSQPSTSAFISKRTPPSEQGGTLGTNQSFASLGRTFGPALGGWLYANLGPLAPYTAAAIGMAFAVLLAIGLRPLVAERSATTA